MSKLTKLVGLLTFSLLKLPSGHNSIIDTKTPIVIHGSVQFSSTEGKTIPNKNYFSYSLAFMGKDFTGNETIRNSSGATLFIGAPSETRFTNNSGVVWQCIFNAKLDGQLSCSILSVVSQQKYPELNSCSSASSSLYFSENQTEQWIGASLSADDGKLYVGAPRWKIKWPRSVCNESAMIGACYVLSSPFDVNLLTPLNQRDKFQFLKSEVGFSSHVIRPEEKLLLGAPSVRQWSGAVFEYEKGERSPFIHNKNGVISEFGFYSLLGYTVTTGRARDRGYYIASGAPRAGNLHGVVAILNSRSSRLIASYKGEQFGSYFGFALATADLNGDGYDELLVGAPLYTSDFKDHSGTYSTGCVLIFDVSKLSDGNYQPLAPKLCMNSQTSPVKVSRGGRFGSAICSLGDINFDNFEDFAVSAPYDDDGVGTVFVYHGGNSLSEKPDKIIRGKSINVPNLTGFGTFLLSGNHVDIDGNGTPDLIVGSWDSGHVVVFRTRPVAKGIVEISFHAENSIHGNEKVVNLRPGSDDKFFRVRICINLTFSVVLPKETQLNVFVNVTMKSNRKGRIYFDNQTNYKELLLRISANGTHGSNCADEKVTLVNITEELTDAPIVFRASFKYNETGLSMNYTQQSADILLTKADVNKLNPESQQVYKNFTKYLPAPIPLQHPSEWTVKELQIFKDNCMDDGLPECDPEFSLNLTHFYRQASENATKPWPANETLVIGQLDSITISIEVSNQKETAYLPTISVTFNFSQNFEVVNNQLRIDWKETPVYGNCNPAAKMPRERNKFTRILHCSRPLHKNMIYKFSLAIENLKHLKMKEEINIGGLTFDVKVFPEGSKSQVKESRSTVPLQGNVQIDVKSVVPAIEQQHEIDPKTTKLVDLTQVYIVENSGYSATSINLVKAEILIPTDLESLPNMVIGIANPTTSGVHCYPVNFTFINISTIVPKQEVDLPSNGTAIKKRSKRSTPMKTKTEPSIGFLTLSGCKDNDNDALSSVCKKIICKLELPSKGSREIRIRMYLLKKAMETLVNEKTMGIRVDSTISVFYLKNISKTSGSTQRKFITVQGVPAWVYIASIAGGSLLLLLMIFTLSRCGFFRRAKKEELKNLKRKTLQDQNFDMNVQMSFATVSTITDTDHEYYL